MCVCVCVYVYLCCKACLVHKLTRKQPNKAQSTNYLHYPLEAQNPLKQLGLGLSKVGTHKALLSFSRSLLSLAQLHQFISSLAQWQLALQFRHAIWRLKLETAITSLLQIKKKYIYIYIK